MAAAAASPSPSSDSSDESASAKPLLLPLLLRLTSPLLFSLLLPLLLGMPSRRVPRTEAPKPFEARTEVRTASTALSSRTRAAAVPSPNTAYAAAEAATAAAASTPNPPRANASRDSSRTARARKLPCADAIAWLACLRLAIEGASAAIFSDWCSCSKGSVSDSKRTAVSTAAPTRVVRMAPFISGEEARAAPSRTSPPAAAA
mmetsp:Transcript_41892/g.103283  ORF Transcript_41892/g.103283 Transcript_41892/m.103283 type:complete len:203 (+) Transcript_41892:1533-2141(+)